MQSLMNRRTAIASSIAIGLAGATCGAQEASRKATADILFPRARVPLSFIIDDSTCLVNMGKYCMPQFAATYPDRADYKRPWESWPDEIPDSFVRKFGEWCAEQGVKGKYSIVPYPACVGWLDRTLPGWSQKQLTDSLQLVRDLMLPNWDIHPEMISHTRAIDLKTGRPYADYSPSHMENSYPELDLSVDHLASYLAYALQILKNCDLPCEGITTPGGFGNRVKDKLAQATFEAVRDVYQAELPHYFKYVIEDNSSTAPVLEPWSGADVNAGEFAVNVPAGTGDWFGGWDGADKVQHERYCNGDASAGRMVELIERSQPAIMLCHWAGMYCNGTEEGFQGFQQVVTSLHSRFAHRTQWMKISEIARYWAAKERTVVQPTERSISLNAPVATKLFTMAIDQHAAKWLWHADDQTIQLQKVSDLPSLQSGTYCMDGNRTVVCFDLTRGSSTIAWE